MTPKLPRDFTDVELELYNFFMTGECTPVSTAGVYEVLDDPVDKFLVAYVFELGNTRKQAEKALGASKATIWKKFNKIKVILHKHFRN